jgi:hypothetical protein
MNYFIKLLYKIFFLALFLSNFTVSQKLSHKLMCGEPIYNKSNKNTSQTIRLLAVMVQFKEDNDNLTTGNGLFDLSNAYNDSIIDAPPHNRQYFLSHLKFLKNYFSKVSNGQVNIEYEIPDKIFNLPDSMRVYATPTGNDFTNVANLAFDTWTLVDKEIEIDFSNYDCFFIFHAGTGRDINLANEYGYDPTPYDIPSLTFNLNSFKKYYGNSFDGIPVNNDKFKITNSVILPESEYRTFEGYGDTLLLELSINGLIVSSFAGYLGLPDLFNTKDGNTAIGRFGLMDGQAIFSYRGIFPPEPSAWEKIYLGWITPKVIQSGYHEVNLEAHRTDGVPSNYEILKVPISDKEYFLLESRYKDPGHDGLRISTEVQGVQKDYYISRDSVGYFDEYGVPLLSGVITDVSDFDWSLPSGFDYKENKLYGGILIWHIDENVIEKGILDNTINNDIKHRGVSVKEADGSQDIGQVYGMLQAGSESENGTALDFWYNDLNYYHKDSLIRPVYTNEFSAISFPNSNSYYGAISHITIYDFSEPSPNMSFKIKIGSENISIIDGFPVKLEIGNEVQIANANFLGDKSNQLVVNSNGKIKIFDTKGKGLIGNSLDAVKNFSILKDTPKNDQLVVNRFDGEHTLEVYNYDNELYKNYEYKLPVRATDSFFIFTSSKGTDPNLRINLLNKTNGTIFHFSNIDNSFSYISSDSIDVATNITYPIFSEPNSVFRANEKGLFERTEFIKLDQNKEIKNFIIGNIDNNSFVDVVYLLYDKVKRTVDLNWYYDVGSVSQIGSKTVLTEVCETCWSNISPLVMGDIDNDGYSDFVFTFNNKLYVVDRYGILIDHYPVIYSDNFSCAKPIIADINGDSRNEIIVISKNGNLCAYNEKGNLLNGYPINIGSKPAIAPIFFNVNDTIGLSVINSDGYLYAWKLNEKYNPDKIAWSGEYANERMTSSQNELRQSTNIKSNEFLPKSRAYNYPNPVYGNSTNIRFFVLENANVKVTIFDISGKLVKTFEVSAIGGMDNEVEWDVSNVQSAIYFANIEASNAEKKDLQVIKIAVIK